MEKDWAGDECGVFCADSSAQDPSVGSEESLVATLCLGVPCCNPKPYSSIVIASVALNPIVL